MNEALKGAKKKAINNIDAIQNKRKKERQEFLDYPLIIILFSDVMRE